MGPERKRISRRPFLKLTLGTTLSFLLVGLGCERKKREKEFILEAAVPIGREKLFLPFGENRPETGQYALFIEQGSLINKSSVGVSVVKDPQIRLEIIISSSYPKLIIEGGIGQFADEEPRSIYQTFISKVDFNQPHTLITSWQNWQFKEVRWDGNILSSKFLPDQEAL